jgi:hypothetical protein
VQIWQVSSFVVLTEWRNGVRRIAFPASGARRPPMSRHDSGDAEVCGTGPHGAVILHHLLDHITIASGQVRSLETVNT